MLRAPTLGELLRTAARAAPDAEALRYRDERLTYGDWDGLADRLAGALAARGIGRGDVVALLLPSTPLYLVAYLAAARLGAITTGINVRYRRTEIGQILQRADAAVLVAVDAWHDADFRGMLDSVRSAHARPACGRVGVGRRPADEHAGDGAWTRRRRYHGAADFGRA